MSNKFRFDTKDYEFNKSSKLGVYIIHGFSSTTYETKQLAEFLGNNGFHAIAKNLPGHGTTPEECNSVKYNHWLYRIKEDIATLSFDSKKIFVIGCSMGGVLALYAASQFPLNACIVGGTVLKFNNQFTIDFTNRLLCRLIKTRNKKKYSGKDLQDEIKFYGYEQYPLIALNEMRKLNKYMLKHLNEINCPALVVHSKADRLSLQKNMDIIYNNINSENKKKLLVDKSHHNLFDSNPDQELIFNEILQFLNKN